MCIRDRDIIIAYRKPAGYRFDDADNSDFAEIGNSIQASITDKLNPGFTSEKIITLEIVAGANSANLVTDAEIIAAAGGTDVDSTPNDNSNTPSEISTDGKITDENTGNAQDDDIDHDDFDPAFVVLIEATCCPDLENRISNGDFEGGNNDFISD